MHIVRAVDSPQLRVAYSGTDYVELLHRGRFNIVTTAESTNFYDFRRNGASDMVIKQGNVGIGTTTPVSQLSNIGALVSDGTDATSISGINWNLAVNRANTYAVGIENSFASGNGLLVKAGDSAGDSYIANFMSDSNSRLVIQEDGNVGIGTTGPNYDLDVNGNINYSGALTNISDIRLKENINDLATGLDKISALRPVSYSMKDDDNSETKFGFIAQEMEEVFPELVMVAEDEQETRSLNYIGIIAPMVKAIQELNIKIETLEQELKQYK